MKAFDFAGRRKLPRGPHAARRLESPALKVRWRICVKCWGSEELIYHGKNYIKEIYAALNSYIII